MAYSKNKTSKKIKGISLQDVTVSSFKGINTSIKNTRDLPAGTATNSLNWITGTSKDSEGQVYGDHIELRRGTALLGQTRQNGNGHISGLGVGVLATGVEVPFYTFNNNLYYYNATIQDTANTGLAIPSKASNDDFALANYTNVAGSMVYISSINSGVYKVMVANPTSPIVISSQLQGYFKIDQNRTFMWNYINPNTQVSNTSAVFTSNVDKLDVSFYTQGTTTTQGTGTGAQLTFTGTLAVPAGDTLLSLSINAPVGTATAISAITLATQCQITATGHGLTAGEQIYIYGIVGTTQLNGITATVASIVDANNFTIPVDSTKYTAYSSGGNVAPTESFSDNVNGTLTSNAGGTGTVNYATGVYSVTFIAPPVNGQAINTVYYIEDATNGGIFDFSFSNPRTNGQGQKFAQFNSAGILQQVWPLADVEYCFHNLAVWQLQLTSDDTQANNLLYRQNVGTPYWRSAWPTGDGIVYLDIFNKANPKIRVLEVTEATTNTNPTVTPVSISDCLDLTTYAFDKCVVFEFGDYYLIFAKNQTNGVSDTVNDICFLYNTVSGFWDILDYGATCLAIYTGTLIAGDSISPNVFTFFSGYDDDGDVINNSWTDTPLNLGAEGQKVFMKFKVRGKIQRSQSINVYFSYDGGNPVLAYTITGTGTGVNQGNPTTVGSYTMGSKIYGGGGTISAFPFEVEIPVGSPRFEYVQVTFQATNIGWAEIDEYTYMDVRFKSQRTLPNNIAIPIK